MNEQELTRLLAEYGGAVRTVCRGILPGRTQDAEEAEADTFFRIWRSRGLPEDEHHLRNYIIRTARSCAIDKYRSLSRNGITLPLDEREDAAFAVELESFLESRELIDLIGTLPPPDGDLFLRRYLYCEPCALLAERYHMPENTIRTRIHRAKGKLQKLLRKENFYD